jgi:hypothetical protein
MKTCACCHKEKNGVGYSRPDVNGKVCRNCRRRWKLDLDNKPPKLSKRCGVCVECHQKFNDFGHRVNGVVGKICDACYFQWSRVNVLGFIEKSKSRYRANADKICAQERERRLGNPVRHLFKSAKARAKKLGIKFEITESDIYIPRICPVLGIPLVPDAHSRVSGSPSLDKIDNTAGYIPGNVAVISWKANRIKNDATVDELRAIVHYMESHL